MESVITSTIDLTKLISSLSQYLVFVLDSMHKIPISLPFRLMGVSKSDFMLFLGK